MNTSPGILLIDKPEGVSSHHVVHKVKRQLKAKKVGHAGTLDPFATGLLVILVNGATRLADFLLADDKAYLATVSCGVTTTTGDPEGEVVHREKVPALTAMMLASHITAFIGQIEQVPPRFSALKYKGRPMYDYARKGIEVPLKARQVRIDDIELLNVSDTSFDIKVSCGKGTYIRSLAHDLGVAIGCGAHLTALRRIQSGHFQAADMLSLAEFLEHPAPWTCVNSLMETLPWMTVCELTEDELTRLLQGKSLSRQWSIENGRVLLSQAQEVKAFGEITHGVLTHRTFL